MPTNGIQLPCEFFDWYEGIYPNKKIRQGHYLNITDEMRAVRQHTLSCGYCGKQIQDSDPHDAFCDRCLDSEYLKEEELHLLRLMSTVESFPTRAPLTDAELAELLPRYVARQTTGKDSRAVQLRIRTRQRVEEKHSREIAAAEDEYKGMIWLLDHDINVANCIFYSHTRRFCFGWQSPLCESVRSALLDATGRIPV